MADHRTLRATVSGRRFFNDPTEDRLRLILQDVESGAEEFVIVERVEDGEVVNEQYVQSAFDPDAYGGFTVEYRDGGPDRHFSSTGHDLDSAHALVAAWSFSRPMPDAEWERLDLG